MRPLSVWCVLVWHASCLRRDIKSLLACCWYFVPEVPFLPTGSVVCFTWIWSWCSFKRLCLNITLTFNLFSFWQSFACPYSSILLFFPFLSLPCSRKVQQGCQMSKVCTCGNCSVSAIDLLKSLKMCPAGSNRFLTSLETKTKESYQEAWAISHQTQSTVSKGAVLLTVPASLKFKKAQKPAQRICCIDSSFILPPTVLEGERSRTTLACNNVTIEKAV